MSFQTLVSINEVSKFYQNGFEALKKINLKIYNGEILALLGPNGAGKTTLINIICGIVTASGGTVFLLIVSWRLLVQRWMGIFTCLRRHFLRLVFVVSARWGKIVVLI